MRDSCGSSRWRWWAIFAVTTVSACGDGGSVRVSPREVAAVGPTRLRIEGHGFASKGPPTVYVGSGAALGVVVQSDDLITAWAPLLDLEGPVDLEIRFRDGDRILVEGGVRVAPREGLTLRPRQGGDAAGVFIRPVRPETTSGR